MLTGLKILRSISIVLVLILGIPRMLNAQASDTTDTRLFETFWTKERIVPKVGVAFQDRTFLEVGIQWHNIYHHPLSLASKGPYTTVDIMIDDEHLLIGPKLGYEFTAGVFGVAGDVTYYYDKNYNSEGSDMSAFVLTPKAGLTLLGFLNFFYGYQIPISKNEIGSISRHRFALTFNLNKDYFNVKSAPKKTR